MRLRHAPLVVDATPSLRARWTVTLKGVDKRRQLLSADDCAVLVDSTGVWILDDVASDDPSTWRRLELSKGRPASAVHGPFVWVCDDGRVLRWTVAGAVDELRVRAESAIALDERRLLITPADAPDELALIGDGAEVWRANGTLLDSCPVSETTFVAGVPGNARRLELIDLANGKARWKSNFGPHAMVSVLAVSDGALWIASTEREVFSLHLDTGRVAHAHDVGVRPPTGGVDAHGNLQICHERRWVTVKLSASSEVRDRLAVSNGPYIDPPVPTTNGGLVVRSGRGGMYLLSEGSGASEILPAGQFVPSIALSGRVLYALHGADGTVLRASEFVK
jgi:hypothetical protein